MPRFEPDRPQPLLTMLGGFEQSRAVNPSAGDDPISLGLFPNSGRPLQMPLVPDIPMHTLPPEQLRGPLPAPAAPPLPPEPASPEPTNLQAIPGPSLSQPGSFSLPNMVLLDEGRVHLNGQKFSLTFEAHTAIMAAVIASYEAKLRDDIDSLRIEYNLQPSAVSRQEVHSAGDAAPMVRTVPSQTAASVPTKARRKRAKNVQPLPEAPAV